MHWNSFESWKITKFALKNAKFKELLNWFIAFPIFRDSSVEIPKDDLK